MSKKAWEGVFEMPVPGRLMKPRNAGLTMVLDKGLGTNDVKDLMETAADYMDFLKLSFGTSAFYNDDVVRRKIDIATEAGVDVYPGGTFLEVTVWQNKYAAYLERAKELGFSTIEVSDGTIEMSLNQRANCIKRALDAGFKVVSEVGKKSPDEKVATAEMHKQIAHDLELGVLFVIVEAREGGKGVGVMDASGAVDEQEVEAIVAGVDDPSKLMWETPIKNQQQFMILKFGNNVNLGNIPFTDVLAMEALRQGLRGDTLKRAIANK
jgi:phosphosulfolactate synthase